MSVAVCLLQPSSKAKQICKIAELYMHVSIKQVRVCGKPFLTAVGEEAGQEKVYESLGLSLVTCHYL